MMHSEIKNSPQKRILFTCLLATLSVHVGAFFYFYKFPPMFPRSWNEFFNKTLPILRMQQKEDESTLLEEFFEPFPEISTLFVFPYDILSSEKNEMKEPLKESINNVHYEAQELALLTELKQKPSIPITSFVFDSPKETNLLIFPEPPPLSASFESPGLENRLSSFPLAIEMEKEQDDETPIFTSTAPSQVNIQTRKERPLLPLLKIESKMHDVFAEKIHPQPSYTSNLEKEPLVWKKTEPTFTITLDPAHTYNLPAAEIIDLSASHFDADLRIMKAPSSKGYLFTVSLKPIKDAPLKKMRHNFTFLIDRSNSIEKHHFASFKKAVLRAISMLQPDDTFNIVLFDKKAVSFSENPISYSKSAFASAETFLMNQKSGGLFAAADLYEFLCKLIPENISEDEVNTLILITDGTTDAPVKKQKAAIQQFLDTNKDRTTLYTAAVGKGNDLNLLDLISTSTGGSLLYSETYAGFARRLAGLVYRLRAPIAKEIKVSAFAEDASLSLYTPSSTIVYSGQPFEVFGTIDKLTSIDLLIEGVYEGEPIRIKKKVHLEKAKTDPAFVTKLLDSEKARENYKKFLSTEAKSILQKKPAKKR